MGGKGQNSPENRVAYMVLWSPSKNDSWAANVDVETVSRSFAMAQEAQIGRAQEGCSAAFKASQRAFRTRNGNSWRWLRVAGALRVLP